MIVIVLLSVLFVAGSLLFMWAWHRPGWIIFVTITISAVLELLQVGVDGMHLGIFGVNLLVGDAATIFLLGTSLLLLYQYHTSFPRDTLPCLALLALLTLSFGRGLSTFAHQAAEDGVRDQLIFATPALAIMLARPAFQLDTIRLARWFSWAGFCLAAIALFRWAGLLPIPVELNDSLREVVRSLPSNYAVIVGQAFIAAIYLQLVERRSAWWWAGAGVLGMLTFALQHRSVWVATAGGLAWLVLRTARLWSSRWQGFAAVAGVILCVIMVAAPMGLLEPMRKMATTNVQEVQSKNSTWAWRVDGYKEATTRLLSSGPVDMLIGPPSGWEEYTTASFAATHIHSKYVETLAYSGIVGFICLILWFWMLAKRVSLTTSAHYGTAFLEALLISELLYLVPYFGGVLQGTTLGLIWVAAKHNNISNSAARATLAKHEFDRSNKPMTAPS